MLKTKISSWGEIKIIPFHYFLVSGIQFYILDIKAYGQIYT